MHEEWRPVAHCPAYAVSNLGRVRREAPAHGATVGRVLKPQVHAKGYLIVSLSVGGRYRSALVHQLVAEAFLGPRPDGCEVDHIDDDPTNPRAENLQWLTKAQNNRKSRERGLQAVGRMMPQAALTDRAVLEIRALAGIVTQQELADRFGVHRSLISRVQLGQAWKHVQAPERRAS